MNTLWSNNTKSVPNILTLLCTTSQSQNESMISRCAFQILNLPESNVTSFLFLAVVAPGKVICWRSLSASSNGLLHTLIVMSDYISYCCLPISLKPLWISGINKAFYFPRELPLSRCFHFFLPILCQL